MACRPAGMSDDESADEDHFFTSTADNSKTHSNNRWSNQSIGTNQSPVMGKSAPARDERTSQEEQELQFRALSACMSGNLDVINEYIEAGRNINDFLHTGWTLLLYAASSALPEVVELLIKNGAKPNKNKDGYTPLMVLCDSTKGTEEQCLRCITMLMEAKANPNAHNKTMKTALMFACKSRESTIVAELLKHVKNLDFTDNDGRTALHYAATANKLETVKLLLKNNASSTIRDRQDLTARDIADTKGFEKIVALFDFEENCHISTYCEMTRRDDWSDMFPGLCDELGDLLDRDIAEILHGMGLECYKPNFRGMDLKTFLKLTEDDLVKLDIGIALHRKQFLDNLHKFHTKQWSIRSIGCIKRYLPYTLYDGVTLLGNAARQIRVIGSSFQFIKDGLKNATLRGASLTSVEKSEYKEELQKTEKTLLLLKKDLNEVLKLAKNIEKENHDMISASYIGKKEKKHNLTIIMSVMIMTGMYLSKTSFVQRLWNN